MQIVRDLAGYTLGRSDLVRRAMSKKKGDVMARERQNFVYGNEEEGVPGCMANGISEEVANKIFDEMTDFAKYAFNKSHAAAYAVVSYQTAYLKYYYPVEFMAALMTSVIDNSTKVAEYIQVCRQMGIAVLPPNVNDGYAGFSVSGKDIRYGLSAIKSIGRPVIDALVQERTENGRFKSLKDFIDRMSGREMNRRAVENFIKGGAFDNLGGTRKQFMQVYGKLMDQITNDRKTTMAGQMSLFDMVAPEEKKQFEIRLPNCGEFSREEMLAMEKEVLGIYVSGHPLQEYEAKWRKNITKTTGDFVLDEESGTARGITDDEKAMIGGIITAKNVKYTKQNKAMAFLTVEDLYGSVEVIVFPREYERYHLLMQEEQKVFIRGRVSAEEDKNGKLICEKIYSFDDARRELWIQFADRETFEQQENETLALLSGSDGQDQVIIYLAKEHAMKRLGTNMTVFANNELVNELNKKLGEKNIKVLEKSIEKM